MVLPSDNTIVTGLRVGNAKEWEYVQDVNVHTVAEVADTLRPGKGAVSRMAFPVTIGHLALLEHSVVFEHRQDAARAVASACERLRSAIRVGPGRQKELSEAVGFVTQSVIRSLVSRDDAAAAESLDTLAEVLLAAERSVNELPISVRSVPREGEDRLRLIDELATWLHEFAYAGATPAAATVDHVLARVWRRAWSLAVATQDIAGAAALAQVASVVEDFVAKLPSVERRSQLRAQIVMAPWSALEHRLLPIDEEGLSDAALDTYEALSSSAVTALMTQLRKAVRREDKEPVAEIIREGCDAELRLRAELGYVRRRQQVQPWEDDDDEEIQQLSARLYGRVRLALSKIVSWAYTQSLAGNIDTPIAQQVFELSSARTQVDPALLVALLRHEQGELSLVGEHHHGWMWGVPTGTIFSPPNVGRLPVWAFVLRYIERSPGEPMVLPELSGAVLSADPESVFSDCLDQAESSADAIAGFWHPSSPFKVTRW